jgi:glycine/D-amino acid oxidase-like deaminating enzyme
MTIQCDVVVVGAGAAGVPAAVAAARNSADVLLVERRAYPGGTAVAGQHRHICGLYSNAAVPDESPLNGGLVAEVCDRLHALAPGKRPVRMGKVDVLPYSPAQLRQVFADLLKAEARLCTMFETVVTDATLDENGVSRLSAGELEIVASAVIDCSGDGAVIRTNSALHEPAPASGRQLAGFTVRILGLEGEADMLQVRVPYEARKAVEAGLLNSSLLFTTFLPGDTPDEGWLRLNLPAQNPPRLPSRRWPDGIHPSQEGTSCADQQSCDPLLGGLVTPRRDRGGFSPASNADTSKIAKNHADMLLKYLKERVPAFRAARLEDCVPEVLEREGPRLKGLYTLTAEDVLGAKTFPDVVARSAWPIELWEPERGSVYRYLEPGRFCEIPLRCLKSAAARNLFCAGRCISATREALGATRVIGCCLALGEAAGNAAAEYAGHA